MFYRSLLFLIYFMRYCNSELLGPDPWNYNKPAYINNEVNLPPDLKTPIMKDKPTESKGLGDWWFRRLLNIVLKNGQTKNNEDESVEVSLQMRFDKVKWTEIDGYLKSDTGFTDTMYRHSVGYVEDAIYKPSIIEKISMAWSDYIQMYIIEYKTAITWTFAFSSVVALVIWLWHHISHKHVIIMIFILLYIYEVIISYKEAEQQELEKFVSAVNTCKWYFWTSDCDVPSPDPLVFMKHMNPLKIVIRMFTSLISEPIIALNSTIKITIQSMTDGLWFPFDKIVYSILIVVINISLIYLLVMVVFNFIFNIPFNLNFLGIVSIGVKQRTRTLFPESTNTNRPQRTEDIDRISGDRLDRLLNVFSVALNNAQTASNTNAQLTNNSNTPTIRRSASTGRLPNLTRSLEGSNTMDQPSLSSNVRKRNNAGFHFGSGDR